MVLKVRVQILECQKMHIMIYAMKLSTLGEKDKVVQNRNKLNITLSKPDGFEIVSEFFKNSAAISSIHRIAIREVDKYQRN